MMYFNDACICDIADQERYCNKGGNRMGKELESQGEVKSEAQRGAGHQRDRALSLIRRLVNYFAHSFFFYMLRSAFFVLLLVWLIFQFKPSSGFVHLVMNRLTGDTEFEAATANVTIKPIENQSASISARSSVNAMSINTRGSCTLSLDSNMYLNGMQMNYGDYLEFTPEKSPNSSAAKREQNADASGFVLFTGLNDPAVVDFRVEEANIVLPSSDDAGILNRGFMITSEEVDISCRGTLYFRTVPNVTVELVHGDGTRAIVDPVAEYAGTLFSLSGEHQEDAQLGEGEEDEIPSTLWWLHVRASGMDDLEVLNLKCSSVAGFSIDANRCSGVEARGNGKLSISYTPTPQEYELQDQRVQLGELSRNGTQCVEHADDLFVDLSYDSDGESLVVSGDVAKARLSGMNLFPDFRNWYFSNVYLAPSTIVSVSFSALAQLVARDNAKKNSDK